MWMRLRKWEFFRKRPLKRPVILKNMNWTNMYPRGDVLSPELSGRLCNFTVKWSCICRTSVTYYNAHSRVASWMTRGFDSIFFLPCCCCCCYRTTALPAFAMNTHASIDHGCHNWPEPSITTVIVQDYGGTLTDRKQCEGRQRCRPRRHTAAVAHRDAQWLPLPT